MVHFAIDDNEIKFCTRLEGKKSWFLPFNKGHNGGAGNPQSHGIKTDLWRYFSKQSLPISSRSMVVVEENEDKEKTLSRSSQIPSAFCSQGATCRCQEKYLGEISYQHSAGSSKSNPSPGRPTSWSGWKRTASVFDSVVVVTDRINLDNRSRIP